MIELITIGNYIKLKLWVNEMPDASLIPVATCSTKLPIHSASSSSRNISCIAAEMYLIIGPRQEYGLLGLEFDNNLPTEGMEIEYRFSKENNVFHNSINSIDTVYWGLIAEFQNGIEHGIEAFKLQGKPLPNGRYLVRYAAHGSNSSSALAFSKLARLLIGYIKRDALLLTDEEHLKVIRAALGINVDKIERQLIATD